MSTFEDRLGVALRDLSDEVVPVHLLGRLQPPGGEPRHSRRLTVVVAAAAAAAVIGVGSLVWGRFDGPQVVDPVQHPPKVFRLSGVTSDAPGRAAVAVTLTYDGLDGAPTYLVPDDGGRVVALPPTPAAYAAEAQQLTGEGDVLVRTVQGAVGPSYVLVDLRSGDVQEYPGSDDLYPALSPDGSTVAEYTKDSVQLVDVAGGSRRLLLKLSDDPRTTSVQDSYMGASGIIGAVGWSPAGDRLAVHEGRRTALVAADGTRIGRLPDARLVNGSQSWSPDGRWLLVYEAEHGRFSARETDGDGGSTVLRQPSGALRPLGWTGSRVVWLSGPPGSQRLLACDFDAQDCQTWMRFDVGAAGVEGVTWSTAYAGTARD